MIKTAIAILGFMGTGKTTLCEQAPPSLFTHISAGRIARTLGITPFDQERIKQTGLHPNDNAIRAEVLHQVLSARTDFILLDGFPRSPEQAIWFTSHHELHHVFLLINDQWMERVRERNRGVIEDELEIAKQQNRLLFKTLAWLQRHHTTTKIHKLENENPNIRDISRVFLRGRVR